MPVTGQRYEPDADLAQLHDHPRNPRRGADSSVAASLDRNGWYGAIIAQQSTSHILAGHTRRRVLTAAGETRGPVIWVDCDDEAALRILLADNRTAELASWDDADLLGLLREITPDDLAAVGFDVADMDVLQRQLDAAGLGKLDAAAEWDDAGMPGYSSEDKQGAYQTTVHFRTDADAEEFFRRLDRPKAKRWWWPEPDGFVGFLSDAEVTAAAGAE